MDDIEYWKARARQWEARAKENSQLLAELEAELQTILSRLNQPKSERPRGVPRRIN